MIFFRIHELKPAHAIFFRDNQWSVSEIDSSRIRINRTGFIELDLDSIYGCKVQSFQECIFEIGFSLGDSLMRHQALIIRDCNLFFDASAKTHRIGESKIKFPEGEHKSIFVVQVRFEYIDPNVPLNKLYYRLSIDAEVVERSPGINPL